MIDFFICATGILTIYWIVFKLKLDTITKGLPLTFKIINILLYYILQLVALAFGLICIHHSGIISEIFNIVN